MNPTTTEAPRQVWMRRLVGANAAEQTFRVILLISLAVFVRVGRRQWFIRDDWAFLLNRPLMREQHGNATWLFTAQDGHWMTPPLVVYRAIQNVIGFESYWPYLVPTMALHILAVVLVRRICHRHGVSPWTTTVLSSLLLLFGSGWEDIVFAIQIVYNVSLVAFLAHLLLVDHDGPVDRRDAIGAVLGVLSIMSSGFGPFFMFGVAMFLGLRRRWRAMAIAVVPQGVLYGWWWLTWGADPVGATSPHSLSGAARYARLGLTATLNGMTGQVLFAGAALLGIIAMCWWKGNSWERRSVLIALCSSVLVMFLGIGFQRAGLGLESATVSRYQYMAAMLLVPAVGLAVDRLAAFDRRALLLAQLLLAVSALQNTRLLVRSSDDWADRAAASRQLFELVAGDPASATADESLRIDRFNPDVTVGDARRLAADGIITARLPATDEERSLVVAVLAGTPVGDAGG